MLCNKYVLFLFSGDLGIRPTCHGIEIPEEVVNKLGEGVSSALLCVCKSCLSMYTYTTLKSLLAKCLNPPHIYYFVAVPNFTFVPTNLSSVISLNHSQICSVFL